MPLVSIVVPVYNAAPYLEQCVNSILSQSEQNIEIILVDDGSTDESGKICNSFAQRFHNIKIVHQSNKGANLARWRGVQFSDGEWISFVDADDTLPVSAYDNLLKKATSETDIVIGKMDGRDLPDSMSLFNYRACCISGEKIHSGPVCKLYRRSLFEARVFDIPQQIIMGEDFIMNIRLAFNTSKPPKFVNRKVYNYRWNANSIMHSHFHTISHSERFLGCVIESIPYNERDHYLKCINFVRWKSLALVIYDRPSDISWKNSSFYLDIKNDIKNHRMKLTIKQKLALMPRNDISKRIIYKLISWLS